MQLCSTGEQKAAFSWAFSCRGIYRDSILCFSSAAKSGITYHEFFVSGQMRLLSLDYCDVSVNLFSRGVFKGEYEVNFSEI